MSSKNKQESSSKWKCPEITSEACLHLENIFTKKKK
jgi:hypothetical protein